MIGTGDICSNCGHLALRCLSAYENPAYACENCGTSFSDLEEPEVPTGWLKLLRALLLLVDDEECRCRGSIVEPRVPCRHMIYWDAMRAAGLDTHEKRAKARAHPELQP